MTSFRDVVLAQLRTVGVVRLRAAAGAFLVQGSPVEQGVIATLREAAALAGLSAGEAVAYLRGAVDVQEALQAAQTVEPVWTGPRSASVPVRATAAALGDVIAHAQRELVLVTYSARRNDLVRAALAEAVARGVRVDVVVETLDGAGSAMGGMEPAAAFADLPDVSLWHWPRRTRETTGAKMHAKVAIADGELLLVSSANLTQSGVHDSLEAGVLVRGGTAPRRSLEHVRRLQASGVLVRMGSIEPTQQP